MTIDEEAHFRLKYDGKSFFEVIASYISEKHPQYASFDINYYYRDGVSYNNIKFDSFSISVEFESGNDAIANFEKFFELFDAEMKKVENGI